MVTIGLTVKAAVDHAGMNNLAARHRGYQHGAAQSPLVVPSVAIKVCAGRRLHAVAASAHADERDLCMRVIEESRQLEVGEFVVRAGWAYMCPK